MDKSELECVCKQLKIEVVANTGSGSYILKDGRIGYFDKESIDIDLTGAQQKAIAKRLPEPICNRAFILSDRRLTFESYIFIQTNIDETGTGKKKSK